MASWIRNKLLRVQIFRTSGVEKPRKLKKKKERLEGINEKSDSLNTRHAFIRLQF